MMGTRRHESALLNTAGFGHYVGLSCESGWLLAGQRVLGLPREIQEVRNAFTAYETMPDWQPSTRTDLLRAHELLMGGLIDDCGQFRRAGVGIYRIVDSRSVS
jgi:Fic family protein